jgi:hypothetical protein
VELKAIFAHCLLGFSMSGLIRYAKEKSWQMVEHLVLILGKLVAFFKKWGQEEGSNRISRLFLTIGLCRQQASPIALGRL